MLAAYRAAMLGAPVTLLEKKHKLGMKILISGGGRCNITHDGTMDDLRAAFRPNEARFLKPSFYRFTNRDIMQILEERGIALYTRPDGRVFPKAGFAKDVVAALQSLLEEVGVQVSLDSPVSRILLHHGAPGTGSADPENRVQGVEVEDAVLRSQHVVLCVGGSSFPGTGTTGDGWPWAQEAGHSIVKVRAALAPLFLESPRAEWAGVALRDCLLKTRQAGKVFASWRGDLLFTHRGLSGPAALGISRDAAERRPAGPVSLEVDLLPDRPDDQLDRDLREWAALNPRQQISLFVEPLAPSRLVGSLLQSARCSPDIRGAYLPQKSRSALVRTLKGWVIGSVQHIPLEKGEVVAGGIALDEVDPQTMQSRKTSGLYLCGEILDIAGPVGGYNLQAAWSTGWVAGESASRPGET